jgi:hypothetical protein
MIYLSDMDCFLGCVLCYLLFCDILIPCVTVFLCIVLLNVLVLYCSLFLYCTVSACDIRAASVTEVLPLFFLSSKANTRV